MCVSLFAFTRARKRKQGKDAGGDLFDLSKNVRAGDIMQKMALDLVVKVAKDGRQQEITFHTWDFGGQEVYYVLHHLFITEGVYCLVFNMCEAASSPDECLRYLSFWLNSTYAHVTNKNDCSILLVGTHRDMVRTTAEHLSISDNLCSAFEHCSFWKRVRKPGATKSCTPNLCFFPVDNTGALNDSGIEAVLGMINVLGEEQVHAREERPLRWLKVLDELQELANTTNYINLKSREEPRVASVWRLGDRKEHDLWSIAQAHGVVDESDFEDLIVFFDNIGIFKRCHSRTLPFKRCQDLVILRPQWLVNVFSAIISCCHQDQGSFPPGLTRDLYRFESKAILSVRLLWHLWEKKGVIEVNEPPRLRLIDVMRFRGMNEEERERLAAQERTEFEEQQKKRESAFELLLELMLRFDLMFEVKRASDETAKCPSSSNEQSVFVKDETLLRSFYSGSAERVSVNNSRQFLVPAMLGDVDVFSTRRKTLATAAAQPVLRCFFVFTEEGAAAVHGSGGMLPAVVFTKLQAKCACWAQTTSNTEPRLSRNHAEIAFGGQQFELQLVQKSCAIVAVLHEYSHPEAIISLLQRVMLDDILAESFPTLTYETNVRDSKSGRYL
jgi:GTPase SAR1 family protein